VSDHLIPGARPDPNHIIPTQPPLTSPIPPCTYFSFVCGKVAKNLPCISQIVSPKIESNRVGRCGRGAGPSRHHRLARLLQVMNPCIGCNDSLLPWLTFPHRLEVLAFTVHASQGRPCWVNEVCVWVCRPTSCSPAIWCLVHPRVTCRQAQACTCARVCRARDSLAPSGAATMPWRRTERNTKCALMGAERREI
jgi:hypothetical protein